MLIAATGTPAQAPRQTASALLVAGNVENRLTLGIGDLQRLGVQRVEDVRQIRMAGASGKDDEQARR